MLAVDNVFATSSNRVLKHLWKFLQEDEDEESDNDAVDDEWFERVAREVTDHKSNSPDAGEESDEERDEGEDVTELEHNFRRPCIHNNFEQSAKAYRNVKQE